MLHERGLSFAGGMRPRPGTTRQLVVIDQEVDPYLEAAAIQRRVYQAGGPALLFRRVKGTAFPMLGNLFGTLDRARYPVPRHARVRPPAGRAEGRSRRARQEPLALPRRAAHALAAAAPAGAGRADPGAPDRDRPAAAAPVLADGRRAVHHAAAGLYRGPRPPGPGAVEPGDVPGPALGQRSTSRTARSGCTTRSTAASACTTRRRSAGASRCGSTSSSAARRP